MDSLEKALIRFRSLSREMRLQMLLNYAKKFPDLPEELQAARDRGLNRVEECQTPLFLWVGLEEGRVRIHADAPPEAPTVRGFMGFLMEQLDGVTPEELETLPGDLLERMGLSTEPIEQMLEIVDRERLIKGRQRRGKSTLRAITPPALWQLGRRLLGRGST